MNIADITPAIEITPDIRLHVAMKLKDLGIPANLKGYSYVKTGLIMILSNPHAMDKATAEFYPSIAKCFNTTWTCVEKAMRHAIEIGFERTRTNILVENFGYAINPSTGKMANIEFLASLAETIRLEMDRRNIYGG